MAESINNMVNFIDDNFMSVVYLTDYMKSYGLNDNLSYCNFNYVKMMLCSFQLSLWKNRYDNIASINKNDLRLISELLETIATKRASIWKIGDLIFKDYIEVIMFFYNKITNGDFRITDRNVLFEHNGKVIYINIDNLVNFSYGLVSIFKMNNKSNRGRKPIGLNTIKLSERRCHISNKNSLKYIVDHFYYLEFFDEPIFPRTKDEEYFNILNNIFPLFINSIEKQIESNGIIDNIDLLVSEYNKYLKDYGIKLSVKLTHSKDIKGKEILFNIYNEMRDEFNKATLEEQIKYVNSVLISLIDDEFTKIDIESLIFLSSMLISIFENNTNGSFDDVLDYSETQVKDAKRIHSVFGTYLASFYCMYVYPFNNVFKSLKEDKVEDIYNKIIFDYSNLDLSKFKPKIFNYEYDKSLLEKKLEKIEEKKKEAILNATKARNIYDNYLQINNHTEFKKIASTIFILEQKVSESSKQLNEIEQLYNFVDDYLVNRLDLYERNKALIMHLKNSILQGNVNIFCYDASKTMDNVKVVFKEFDGDNIVFELSIKIKDFLSLFSEDNIKCIRHFIKNSRKQNNYDLKKKLLNRR